MTTTSTEAPAKRARTPKLLPALPAITGLDVDELDRSTRGLDNTLIEAISKAALQLRQARAARLGEQAATKADCADLILRLQHTAEVLGRIADDFSKAAKHAQAEIADDVLQTLGRDQVAIPDKDGTEVIVGPTSTSKYFIDDAVIAEVEAGRAVSDYEPDVILEAHAGDAMAAITRSYTQGFTEGWSKVAAYGKTSWRSTDVTKLSRDLMAAAELELAAKVERAMSKNTVWSDELSVKREVFKAGRRT